MENKYICHLGPGKDMPGGILSVIEGYLSSEYLKTYKQIHIPTASASEKKKVFLLGTRKYVGLLLNKKIQLAHIHMSENGSCYRAIILILLGNLFGIPTIIHSHGSEIETWYSDLPRFNKLLFNFAMSHGTRIIVLTPGWEKFWTKIVGKKKIIVIPNFIKIKKVEEKNYLQNNILNIVFLGYIGERKGTYDLIRAIAILKKQGYSVCLRIGGNGEIDKCQKLIEEHGLTSDIFLYGWLDEHAKQTILEMSDCLVLPSKFESFGIVILEAMTNKIPVICGNAGYSKELIENEKDGLVAKSGDPQSIAKCIQRFVDINTLKNFGETAYDNVSRKYSEDIVIKKLKDLYDQLTK